MSRRCVTFSVLLTVLFYLSCVTDHVLSRHSPKTGPCTLSYFKSMKVYECVDLNLSEIPQRLSSSTEILDLSFNRIRELKKSSFEKYSYLVKVYLNDNMIMNIDPDTFDGLKKLETIDLSMNAIIDVPIATFHLPSLQKLILSNNMRLNIVDVLNRAVPITAPLQLLDISYCPLLTQLPQFGVMLDLLHLNVTGNRIGNVSIENFVGLCNLRWFSSQNATIEFATDCDCERIDNLFTQMKVHSIPTFTPRCIFAKHRCMGITELTSEDIALHEQCTVAYESRQNIQKVIRISYIVFGIAGGIILLVGVCYIYYRLQRLPTKEKPHHGKELKCDANNDTLLKSNNND